MRAIDPFGVSWRKSSRCGHGECIEVASAPPSRIAVRDSKDNASGPNLVFRPVAWRSFIADVKKGHADA